MKNTSIVCLLLVGLWSTRSIAQIEVVSGGKVGIGTSSPAGQLDVAGIADGGAVFFRSAGRPFLDIKGAANSYKTLRFSNGTSDSDYRWDFNILPGNDATNPDGLGWWSATGGQVFTIKANGTVGIGTATPADKLHVAGNVMIDGYKGFVARYNTGDGYRGHLSWDHVQLGNNGNNYIVAGNTATGGALGFVVNNTNDLTGVYADTNKNGTVAVQITSAGNVGIGTLSPASRLHIYQSSGGSDHLTLATNFSGGNSIALNPFITGINNGGFEIRDASNNVTRLAILPTSGNIGIGTTAPTQKLEVTGSVKATSFISSTQTYADFVFKPDYALPALSEVEAHIKTHGHLPGIPSEAEAREHGIDLASMQVKLLQKIEELTLHQIAQEKRLNKQSTRLGHLEIENAALHAALAR